MKNPGKAELLRKKPKKILLECVVESTLIADEISRYFDKFRALAPTYLEFHPGQITILQGPNGAGKSTLLQCLSGLIRPSTGKITVAGFDLYQEEREAKKHLAFVPDVPRFYQEMTAWEHLKFMAAAHSVLAGFEERAERLLRTFGLWDARDLFPHNYSRGMRLKLGLLLVFIRPLDMLILDEPTSALDEESTRMLADHLVQLRSQGKSILLSSHHNQWVEPLADRILKMQAGSVLEG
jgi:ABC-2 type transport system ATP-binding protein